MEEAFAGPQELAAAQGSLHRHGFAVWYRPEQSRVLVILRQGVSQQQILRGAFSAHVFLHMLREEVQALCHPQQPSDLNPTPSSDSVACQCEEQRSGDGAATQLQRQRQQTAFHDVAEFGDPSCMVQLASDASEKLYPNFLQQAEQQGWQLDATMLNTKDVRLCMA